MPPRGFSLLRDRPASNDALRQGTDPSTNTEPHLFYRERLLDLLLAKQAAPEESNANTA